MKTKKAPWYFLGLLILAGESVFILPFVLARIFRPTVLESFAINQVELGFCFSTYGVVALISYLLGGPIADKYEPRKLMSIGLWATALGGFCYSTFPSYTMLKILYGYWGFTTIFLFWAPMIKATRIWGEDNSQGKAFGFLDGGRGLVGALFGILGVYIFSKLMPTDLGNENDIKEAYRYVVIACSCIVIFVGFILYHFLRIDEDRRNQIEIERITKSEIKEVLQLPSVWMLMTIILCAYTGYKSTDYISNFANDVMFYNKIQSAKIGTVLLFTRPIIGVFIGLTAHRIKSVLLMPISFGITIIGSLLFVSGSINPSSHILFFFTIITIGTGVYAMRSLYFAVMERGQIPLATTGTAVGIISLVGYAPDIFAGPMFGYMIDNSPGMLGYQKAFVVLTIFSVIGGIVSYAYYRKYR